MKANNYSFRLLLIILFLLGTSSLVLADIALPEAKGFQIQTKQDFPDFDFYLVTIPTRRTYGPEGGIETFFENLELNPVSLTSKSPYFTLNSFAYDEAVFFLGIKKVAKPSTESELKAKIVSVIKDKPGDGIYFFYLSSQIENEQAKSITTVVYTIESIDNSGIKTSRTLDESIRIPYPTFVYVASGLSGAGFVIAIGLIYLFLRRKKNNFSKKC